MAYSTGLTSGLAVSEDGLNFKDSGEVSENAGGVPGLLQILKNYEFTDVDRKEFHLLIQAMENHSQRMLQKL